MRKVGLFIVTLLHDITQAGYSVKFNKDFNGMMRVDFFKEQVAEFYEHLHCGFPGASRDELEKHVIQSLIWFKTTYSIEDRTRHDDDPTDVPPAA